MINIGDYPLGANEDPNAPWHEKNPKMITVPVIVSVTYHKYMNVEVPENYKEQEVNLLNDAAYEKLGYFRYNMETHGWFDDEFETIEDE